MQQNLRLFVGLILLECFFVIFGCTAEAEYYQKEDSNSPSGSPTLSREDAVREAVFKYQIDRMTSALQQKDVVFFLSVDEEPNPSDALLTHFAGRRPPVKKVPESVSKEYEGIFDKETGNKGILATVRSTMWISETEAEVEGGHYTAPLEASGHVYKVRYESRRWVVKYDEMKWIS